MIFFVCGKPTTPHSYLHNIQFCHLPDFLTTYYMEMCVSSDPTPF